MFSGIVETMAQVVKIEQEQSNKAKEIIKAIFFITLPHYHYLLDIYFNFIKNINHHNIYTHFFDFKTGQNSCFILR